MVKLNLGCGERQLHGFMNIDTRSEVNPDVICDVAQIHEKFEGVDLIYACHVLEHFPSRASKFQSKTWKDALRSWFLALKEGGTLRVAVPDAKAACEYYLLTNNFDLVRGFFYGSQTYDYDFHYHSWTEETLTRDLLEIGFKKVQRYDWRQTEHFYVDDYSQSYLPHMDKANGKLMSLNVEATK